MKKHGNYLIVAVLCTVLGISIATVQSASAQKKDDGIELYNSGAFDKAETNLRKTLATEPGNATVRYYLGLALIEEGKYPEAVKELETVESEQEKANQGSRPEAPSEYQIDLALTHVYLHLNQLDKAWAKLESARAENPDSSDVFLYRGMYFYQTKKYEAAVKDLKKSIQLNSKNAYAYYYIGLSYSELGQAKEMVDAFKIFLQLAPGAPEAPDVKIKVDQNC
jgi:type IV pilus assembly protein PilF